MRAKAPARARTTGSGCAMGLWPDAPDRGDRAGLLTSGVKERRSRVLEPDVWRRSIGMSEPRPRLCVRVGRLGLAAASEQVQRWSEGSVQVLPAACR